MSKKYKVYLSSLWLALLAIIGLQQPTIAQGATTTDTMVTLGTTLTQTQRQGTLDTLTKPLNDAQDYQTLTVDGNTLVKYLNPSGNSFTSSSKVWSSAAIEKTNSGSGINVQILPYNGKNNITTITEDQYKNAALTAGIADANIYVTSAVPIDGSGALAGIYAAFAQNGDALNQSQVNAAQSEINTLSDITSANQDKDGYSDAQLNRAVAGAKTQMAQQGGTNISVGDITTIVNNQIEKNDLQNVLTDAQKQDIIDLLVKIRNSGALDSSDFKAQAKKLSSDILDSAKNIFDKLDTPENQNFFQKIWTNISNFFKNLFN